MVLTHAHLENLAPFGPWCEKLLSGGPNKRQERLILWPLIAPRAANTDEVGGKDGQ